jgi:hypothetical protein
MWQLKKYLLTSLFKLTALVCLLILFGIPLLTRTILAQDDVVRPAVSDPSWQGSYWNNMNLSGAPAIQRSVTDLDFVWGQGSPDRAIRPDQFSARWTRYLYLDAGLYRFRATSDDGVRVFVNDELIINGWSDHAEQTFMAHARLASGHHLVRVEYYENSDQALLRVDWSLISGENPTPQNWRAEFYNNRDLVGSPVLVRDDAEIAFNWQTSSPAPGVVNQDNFSARWSRTQNFAAGNYRFRITVDDGARLWVNNALIIDQWRDQSVNSYTSDIYLPGGVLPLRLEYYDNAGAAAIRLSWESLDQSPTPTATPRPTPTPTAGPPPVLSWRGEYFANRDLSGAPVLVRDEKTIDFNWGGGSPAPGVIGDNAFSVRWTRSWRFDAGRYRFRVRTDDGARLWVKDRLLIDQWRDQADTTYTAEMTLQDGQWPIKVEYYENSGAALIQLTWERMEQPPTSNGKKWRAEYFNNHFLKGLPDLVRTDQAIDFNWGAGSPAPGVINNDYFSVRWSIRLNFSGGRYRFTTESDDGVRLYIDNRLVINQWREMSRTRFNVEVDLRKGDHDIRLEYFDQTGAALARLGWKKIVETPAPVGNIITCVPPQPANNAWIRLYRLDNKGAWYSTGRGVGSVDPSGYLKIDGLPVDTNRFGNAGEPYRVEQWVNGRVVRSTGNFQAGEPEFRVRPFADNYTPWQCR